jgi:arginyl-tRNA synthetase
LWQNLVHASIKGFDLLYDKLGLGFDRKLWYLGESFYQDKIDEAIDDLKEFVKRSDSDQSVLLFTGIPEAKFKGKNDKVEEVPLILRKSDGGIGYDATDTAAIRYRLKCLNCDKLLYVTDSGQSLHFLLVFRAALIAGWTNDANKMVHIPFGLMKKESGGGKIKTREGSAESLETLLDKAVARTENIFLSKRKDGEWSSDERHVIRRLAEKCGICNVIFADLKQNRLMDYEFSVERMCTPDGDTAIFLLHVRGKLIRCLNLLNPLHNFPMNPLSYDVEGASIKERSLAVLVSKYHDVIENCYLTLSPHVICQHMLQVAREASSVLVDSNEPVFDAENGKKFHSNRGAERYALLTAVRNVLEQEFKLIGMEKLLEDVEADFHQVLKWKHVEVL